MGFLDFVGAAARGVNTAFNEGDRLHREALAEADAAIARAQKMLTAGDTAGAYAMARNADAAYGRVGPKLIGTYKDAPAPIPPAMGAMAPGDLGASVGAPEAPRFGVSPNLGPSAAALPTSLGSPLPPARGAMAKTYDPSTPDFENPANQEAVRKYVGAPPQPVEYGQLNPFEITYDKRTGKVVRQADEKPVTPTFFNLAPGETRYQQTPTGAKPVASRPAKPEHFVLSPGQTRYEQTPGGAPRPVAHVDPKPPASTPESREIAKRAEAAVIVARAISQNLGGVPKVHPETADIELTQVQPLSPSMLRKLENAAIDMGGFLYTEPGQNPRIILNPGSTAAHVAAKVKDPRLTWVRNDDGTKTRVEDKPGVTSAAPPPKAAKPFDVGKADKAVRIEMSLRSTQRIPAARQAEYDQKIAAKRAEHNRVNNGGKTLLQTLMEEPD